MHIKHDTEILPPLTQLAYSALETDDLIIHGILGSDMVEGLAEVHRIQRLIIPNGWKRQKKLESGRRAVKIEYRVYKRKIGDRDRWLTLDAAYFLGVFMMIETLDREPY